VFAQVQGNMAIAASLLTVVNFVADMGMGPIPTVNNVACASIPSMVLPTGYRIRTSTANFAATDGYTASVLCVERLDEPPHLSPMTGTAEEEAVHDYLQAIREGEMS
jgi:hypothetical protein